MHITLHKKYGANPTIPICFWCGEDKDEVVLLGASYKDEAPRHLLIDYKPCDTCKENMAKGVTIIETTYDPTNNLPPIQENPKVYPTGRFTVVRKEAISNLFTSEATLKAVLKAGRILCASGIFQTMIPTEPPPKKQNKLRNSGIAKR